MGHLGEREHKAWLKENRWETSRQLTQGIAAFIDGTAIYFVVYLTF